MKLLPSACFSAILATTLSTSMAQQAPADAPPASAAMAPAVTDLETVAARVKSALQHADGVPARGLSVATHASTIVLTGEVDTEAQRVAALSAAEKAAGGVRISNNLEVRAAADRSPAEKLAAQQSTQVVRDVESALKGDSRVSNLGITVSSADGRTVVLQGLVPSRDTRTAVQNVVSKVAGVSRVDNRLLVPGDPIPQPAAK